MNITGMFIDHKYLKKRSTLATITRKAMVQLQKYLKNLILFYLKNIMYICCVDTTYYSTVNLKQQHGKAFKII